MVSVAMAAHTLWTSTAPALTYRLYAEEGHLSHTVTEFCADQDAKRAASLTMAAQAGGCPPESS
jgi:hypothetical protein